ncbi:ABC transporter substrate-binding protein [Enterococcus faecium]
MKKFFMFMLGMLMIINISGCRSQEDVEITFSSCTDGLEYKNIVAGTSTAAEYLSAFNVSLKGVSDQENIPSEYSNVERIGSPRKVNMEKIMSIDPDLFVGDIASPINVQEQIKKQGIKALWLDNSSYENVLISIEKLGKVLNQKDRADKLIKEIKLSEENALKGIDDLKGRKVALLFGTGESYMLATEKSYLGSLLSKLGVQNVASEVSKSSSSYVKFSLESIVSQNPDYILTLAHGHKEQAAKAFEEEFKKDLWQTTNAIKQGNVYALDDKIFPVTGNIRVAETTESLKWLLLKGETNK